MQRPSNPAKPGGADDDKTTKHPGTRDVSGLVAMAANTDVWYVDIPNASPCPSATLVQAVDAAHTALNDAKTRIDEPYKTRRHRWLEYMRAIDPLTDLRVVLKVDIRAQAVTRAWIKFYELLSWVNFADIARPQDGARDTTRESARGGTGRPVRQPVVFHNAELPGAGVFATKHYMAVHKISYDWRASSLMPDAGSEALEDQYGLYANYKDKWLMSHDSGYDGDMTKWNNITHLSDVIGPGSAVGGVDLYTSDAGMSNNSDFNEQEARNHLLHRGCALAGFRTMRPGATFIAKQYTWLNPESRDAMAKYARLFERFLIVKPVSSPFSNSESYLVGIGYKPDAGVIAALEEEFRRLALGTPTAPQGSPEDSEALCASAIEFAQRQTDYINALVDNLDMQTYDIRRMFDIPVYKRVCDTWLSHNKITRIDKALELRVNRHHGDRGNNAAGKRDHSQGKRGHVATGRREHKSSQLRRPPTGNRGPRGDRA